MNEKKHKQTKYIISEHKICNTTNHYYLLQCQIPNFMKFKNKFRQII